MIDSNYRAVRSRHGTSVLYALFQRHEKGDGRRHEQYGHIPGKTNDKIPGKGHAYRQTELNGVSKVSEKDLGAIRHPRIRFYESTERYMLRQLGKQHVRWTTEVPRPFTRHFCIESCPAALASLHEHCVLEMEGPGIIASCGTVSLQYTLAYRKTPLVPAADTLNVAPPSEASSANAGDAKRRSSSHVRCANRINFELSASPHIVWRAHARRSWETVTIKNVHGPPSSVWRERAKARVEMPHFTRTVSSHIVRASLTWVTGRVQNKGENRSGVVIYLSPSIAPRFL